MQDGCKDEGESINQPFPLRLERASPTTPQDGVRPGDTLTLA